jgi:hypothetical protein
MLVKLLAGLIIDVGEGVKLVGYNVNVVAADAVALAGDALAFIGTGNGVDLTAADFALLCVEVGGNGVDTGRVAYEDNLVG